MTFELIHAANYLDIRPLLDLLCRTVANSVIGKTEDEVYEMFGVKEKLTEEELAEVRKENPWLEDDYRPGIKKPLPPADVDAGDAKPMDVE